jgi:3-hydroxyacyl-CoA dehydrogenase
MLERIGEMALDKIVIIAAGVMGQGIAETIATTGTHVILLDRTARLDDLSPEETIFTTNALTISKTELASVAGRADRLEGNCNPDRRETGCYEQYYRDCQRNAKRR